MPGDVVRFPSIDEAVAIQERLIEVFGGPPGVRDPGLVESALFLPQTGYTADLPSTAAALFESLLTNHPFADGNERVAFFGTDVFPGLDAFELRVDPDEAQATLIGLLEEGCCDFDPLLPWIRSARVSTGT